MFRVIDLAENAGYGFEKMFNGWLSYYSKKPVITEDIDNYKIEFYFDKSNKDGIKLSQNQKIIINHIINNSSITADELSLLISINKRNIEKNLSQLQEKKIIERVGSRKSGHWKIIKKNVEFNQENEIIGIEIFRTSSFFKSIIRQLNNKNIINLKAIINLK